MQRLVPEVDCQWMRLASCTLRSGIGSGRVSGKENDNLMIAFSGEEIDEVFASMKVDTTPGPDGFSVVFFKHFWHLVKPLILDISNGFALGRVDISRLNFGVLSLIPNVPGAEDINVIFKFVAKTYAIRLSPVAHRMISRTQSAFIKGQWVWSGGQTTIALNGDIGNYFRNGRDMRQVDSLSPLLFDYVVEALATILDKARELGHIAGVVRHLIPGGVSHLQYAYDTIIMIQPDDLAIVNLRYILLCFESMLGLRINFHKSEVMVMGLEAADGLRIAHMLNCKQDAFPFTYLGVPVSDRALSAAD
ncbi:uncharacterized protein [Lolium perenne]|uniref:uncharacterized protein n=1 Tax=Lolium perenne TaxID=4522 RepID=UPI003A99FF13